MSEQLTTVRLYGSLAKICGRELKIKVFSVAEAVKALLINFPELKEELCGPDKKYNIIVGSTYLGEDELSFPFSPKETLRIVPVVTGAGGDFLKIVVGVALVWATGGLAGFGASGLSFFSGAAAGSFAASLGGVLGAVGMSLILGGVSSLFISQPDTPDPVEAPENKPSFYFRGAVNTTAQGHPVAVGYGELRIGSAVIGAGLVTRSE